MGKVDFAMKRILIALIICFTMLSTADCATLTPTRTVPIDWQTFNSQRNGYTVAFPPDWQVSETPGEWPGNQVAAPLGNGIDTFHIKDANINNLFNYVWIMVASHSMDSGESLEKWADRYPTIFLAPYRGLCESTEPSSKIQIGNETAILYSYFCQSGDIKHKAHTAMLTHNGQGFIVVMWNPPDTDEVDQKTFKNFWSSLVFTK